MSRWAAYTQFPNCRRFVGNVILLLANFNLLHVHILQLGNKSDKKCHGNCEKNTIEVTEITTYITSHLNQQAIQVTSFCCSIKYSPQPSPDHCITNITNP